MKSILTVIAILVLGYWASKFAGQESARRDIAQAKAIGAWPEKSPTQPTQRSIEQDVSQIAQESRQRGLPRQISPDVTLLSVSASGSQLIGNYEFSAPAAIPITNQLISELRQEILQNFRSSATCTDPTARALLNRGWTLVQKYNLYRSNQTILTIQLGASNC